MHPTGIGFVVRLFILFATMIAAFQSTALSAEHGALTTPADAVAHLQILWHESLSSTLQARKDFTHLNNQISDTTNIHAQRMTSSTARKRASLLLSFSPGIRRQLIAFGSPDALKPNVFLWAVYNLGTNDDGFEAYLDAGTGKLLLLWIIPEG